MKKKTTFEVIVASSFITDSHSLPIPSGDAQHLNIDIEFDSNDGGDISISENKLDEYIRKNYPNKQYKIYYWW